MSTPSSVDSSLWDADNYDMLMKTMTHPPSPPHTSDSECEAMSPVSDTPSSPPVEDKKEGDEKKPTKKRKSWGQELPTPTTNLPPRKRAKTDAEKEQRRIERVLRNRAAAHSSRERKRAEQEALEKRKKEIEAENENMKNRLSQFEQEFADLQKKYRQLEHNYLLAKSHLPSDSGFNPVSIPEDSSISSGSISMSDVQALSPQSLIQSPTVKTEDLTPVVLAKPVLIQTQHHATMLCIKDLQCLLSNTVATATSSLLRPLSAIGRIGRSLTKT
ncbi:hypothetical protein TWF106_000366 [Orbilia oligospora]|uniref:BZIP domain-containing protein n=1 Tax=Orbilia oligospora TaxID=2813651 RepID=A0A6G1MKM0_ORBOL|nr:hypothetical protein TWF788_003851 [Orbilia oligospora]KAF3203392.1 hypothetical protein TWF679_010261 [Orbilia oligospora]KAF3210674.1 hypothetical protein TWF191_011154 [Orbilia oligospora]KAF3226625.1 hypothetical protein TWF106_000366 [Orbilia oligospora]KAF3261121.1 hypothetical protein TWF192_009053 [Orbilia oligospora]